MDFFEVIRQRHSVRVFADQPVERDKLEKVLRAANLAPSAGDLQAYEIYVVTKMACRRELAEAALGQRFIAQAPVTLVFLADPERSGWRYGERGRRLYAIQDATIAASYIQLAAVALGLATVWVGAFSDNRVIQAIGAPASMIPVAILPLGYPAEHPTSTPRRGVEALVRRIE